jgi:TonB family protein
VQLRLAVLLLCGSLAAAQTADDYRQRIRANPSSSATHYDFGVFLMGQNDLQAAAAEFEAALKGDLLPPGIDGLSHKELDLINEARLAQRLGAAEKPPVKKSETIFVPIRPGARISGDYSDEARAAGLEGAVFVYCELGEDGMVTRATVSEPLGMGLDQKAIEAVKQTNFGLASLDVDPADRALEVEVDFELPSKQSRWHLMRVSFEPEEGVTPPAIARAKYPLGAGISMNAVEEGRLLGAIGRFASATIAFDVDEHGHSRHFAVRSASADVWGPEAIALVSQWQFRPATKNGQPVQAQCVLDLIWGPRVLPADSLTQSHSVPITITQH